MHRSEELQKEITANERQILELKDASKQAAEEIREHSKEEIAEAEAKCKELENSFFDLQMENLQLKKELENYRRNME